MNTEALDVYLPYIPAIPISIKLNVNDRKNSQVFYGIVIFNKEVNDRYLESNGDKELLMFRDKYPAINFILYYNTTQKGKLDRLYIALGSNESTLIEGLTQILLEWYKNTGLDVFKEFQSISYNKGCSILSFTTPKDLLKNQCVNFISSINLKDYVVEREITIVSQIRYNGKDILGNRTIKQFLWKLQLNTCYK